MCKVERRNFHPLSLRVKWQIMKPENASALIKKNRGSNQTLNGKLSGKLTAGKFKITSDQI